MSTWQYIIEQYGSPIKMKLQISELKRKLFNTIKDREDLREYSFELNEHVRNTMQTKYAKHCISKKIDDDIVSKYKELTKWKQEVFDPMIEAYK